LHPLPTPVGAVNCDGKPAMSYPHFPTRGQTYETLVPGTQFVTDARTVTETDLVNFVSMFGFNEPLFVDARGAAVAGYTGRLVPGALTYCMAEGLVLQTRIVHATGIAFLGMDLDIKKPVYVGDTIHATCKVTGCRPVSAGGRGLVTTHVAVLNQHDDEVLIYNPVRLVAGRSEP
jgi:acyl dehydratase